MTNSENPRAATLVKQNWAAWVQAMRMAKNLMKSEEPLDFHDNENKERYYAYVPMVAMTMVKDMFSDSAFLEQAPEKVQEERLAMVATCLRELKAFNDEIEENLKK